MPYAFIGDGIIQRISEHPRWLNDAGELATDEQLRDHGVVPVDFESGKPEYDPFHQVLVRRPMSEWEIQTETVLKLVDPEPTVDETATMEPDVVAEPEVVEPQYVEVQVPVKVVVTYQVRDRSLDDLKAEYRQKILAAFLDALRNGRIDSSLGFPVDCRRSDVNNDLQNLDQLISLGTYPMQFKGADNQMYTIPDEAAALQLRSEMVQYGLGAYQRKWDRENALDAVQSIDELRSFEVW